MDNKVSLRDICKSLYENEFGLNEGDYKNHGDHFEDYYKGCLKKVKDIFGKFGINNDVLKDNKGKYLINSNQRENISELITSYTSKSMKKIRKLKFEEIAIGELEVKYSLVESILKESLNEELFQEELIKMDLITNYHLLKGISEVEKEGLEEVKSNIDEIKPFITEKFLNQEDKVMLLNFYNELIKNTSNMWKDIVEIYCEVREVEMFKEVNNDVDNGNTGISELEEKIYPQITERDNSKELDEKNYLKGTKDFTWKELDENIEQAKKDGIEIDNRFNKHFVMMSDPITRLKKSMAIYKEEKEQEC